MNNEVVGIGIDLTQHVPLVSVAVCPEAIRVDSSVDVASLTHHWPPKVELRGAFHPQLPSAVLPLIPGEPLLVGDAAAVHRRSAGLVWPPEAQVPYDGDPACGVGRIPLVAAWTALLPSPGTDEGLARRDDLEFKWCPEEREHTARAGQILAASIKAFLNAAGVLLNSCLTAIVVPNALDEAGQQILLDSLAQVGLATEKVHLLPRPLAVSLHWCSTLSVPSVGQVDRRIGRVRVVTMALDMWEAVSLGLHACQREDRMWIVPVRNRILPPDAPPELHTLGLSFALALACADMSRESLGWWPRVFASNWLEKRLAANHDLSPQELQAIREVRSPNLLTSLRQEFSQLGTLQSLWSFLFQSGPISWDAIRQRWEGQERHLGTGGLPCTGVLADGSFAGLLIRRSSTIGEPSISPTLDTILQVSPLDRLAAVRGAALAAAAIANGLPCYRETLLPLDLYVRGTNEYGDPMPQWQKLVVDDSVEAGQLWRSKLGAGLQIQQGQDQLLLPLRRMLRGKPMFRQVSTELATAAKHDEPVRVEVEVKPGQGFARVRIESVTPGMFGTRLDWRTMEECDEPKLPQWAYLPGVSRIVPDEQMFNAARPVLEAALHALRQNRPDAIALLREAIEVLNDWPLAHNEERKRGRTIAQDFMLHYGVIGSNGNLDKLPEPSLAREIRNAIGEKFDELVQQRQTYRPLGKTLLRAGGWFYLAIPLECFNYLQSRLRAANRNLQRLSPEELHAIGLAFEAPDDLLQFYPLVVQALRTLRPNNWLRAVRNICRFRNHALHPNAISDSVLYQLTEQIFEMLQRQAEHRNFARSPIFRNCLEPIPFLLKRRRYDPEFLAPTSPLAQKLIHFLDKVDRVNHWQLGRLQPVPRATINFLQREATESDIEALLGVEEEGDDDDGGNSPTPC
jgi:hypothetical protein